MKKLLYASDIHGNKLLYEKLLLAAEAQQTDKIIIGGDLCPHLITNLDSAVKYQRGFITDFLVPLIKDSKLDFYLIMGNDDFRVNMDLLESANDNGILKLLHKRVHKLFNIEIVGYSFVNQMPFLLKDWEKLDNKNSMPLTDPQKDIISIDKEDGTIKEDLDMIKNLSKPEKTIYVMHAPPFYTNLDMIYSGVHVGSKSIRRFIEKEQPLLTLHGHIHESPKVSGKWMDKIGKTICINAGSEYQNSILNYCIIDLEDITNIKKFEL